LDLCPAGSVRSPKHITFSPCRRSCRFSSLIVFSLVFIDNNRLFFASPFHYAHTGQFLFGTWCPSTTPYRHGNLVMALQFGWLWLRRTPITLPFVSDSGLKAFELAFLFGKSHTFWFLLPVLVVLDGAPGSGLTPFGNYQDFFFFPSLLIRCFFVSALGRLGVLVGRGSPSL